MNDHRVYAMPNYRWEKLIDSGTPSPRSLLGYTNYDDGFNEYFVVFVGALIDGTDNSLYV